MIGGRWSGCLTRKPELLKTDPHAWEGGVEDAKIVDKKLIEWFKKKEYLNGDVEYFDCSEFDEGVLSASLMTGWINKKWIVVIDYHS